MRCVDCHGRHSVCRQCLLSSHVHLPFHRVEVWNGRCFIRSSLFDQGYVLHVGHGNQRCPLNQGDLWEDVDMAEPDNLQGDSLPDIFDGRMGKDVIVVVDSAGVFQHQVAWCTCNNDHPMQLFKDGLFPASFKRPETVFTFRVLDDFYLDAMECTTVARSFYQKIRRMTNSTFPSKVPVSFRKYFIASTNMNQNQNRYRELMRVSRQWRDLVVRKRFGYAHATDDLPGDGDLALFCASCPQPGINLQEGWQEDPDQ
jgi:hypothetical protein